MSESAYAFEREEWRNAVEAAEDAGEIINDRPTEADLFWDSYDPSAPGYWEEDDDE